jgi:hypothetical protein
MSTIYSPAVTVCTSSLTFSSSTFCPQTVFMCFVWISEQRVIVSLYSINWLVFITEGVCLLCGTDWIFMCFVWISEQTAIISLYSINWLVFITETGCVYCAVRTGSLYVIEVSLAFKLSFFLLSSSTLFTKLLNKPINNQALQNTGLHYEFRTTCHFESRFMWPYISTQLLPVQRSFKPILLHLM